MSITSHSVGEPDDRARLERDLSAMVGKPVHTARCSKERVIERLCALAREVGEAHDSQLAYDCFCGHPDSYPSDPDGYRFEVLDFMEEAVREKIARLKAHKSDDIRTAISAAREKVIDRRVKRHLSDENQSMERSI